jgi:GNAT superfamily N-acetyltransferase
LDAITPHAESILPTRVVIDRNRWVSIRPIERTDAAGLSDFYDGLSPESLRCRFLGGSSLRGRELARGLGGANGDGLVAILHEVGPNDGAIIGHATLQSDGCGGAEIAFAVADRFQGLGIGTAMFEAVVRHARETGIHRLTASLFTDNGRMRRLIRRGGHRTISDQIDAGVEEISLAV